MNERILELVKQATKHYPATESSGEFSTFDKELFAELIVADCVKIIESWAKDDFAINGIAIEILDHFDMELGDEV